MGNIISRKDPGGSSSYYQYSALSNDAGNVTSLTGNTQSTVATYEYEAFGNIVSETGTANNNYKFSTKNLDDESGLYYFGARYYDPEIGRFITKDPDGGDVTDPQSLNPYGYVKNNPLNLVDPDGEYALAPAVVLVGTPQGWVAVAILAAPANLYAQWYVSTKIGTWAGTKLRNWVLAKGGKQKARDTGLSHLPDSEISKRARNKNFPKSVRKKYQKEEK